jgi:UDP:flavonoid glycosyltransferase YjiC (YdhE family)
MHITIIAFGTQGDVQPFIALGKGLEATGDCVTVVTHDIFQTFVELQGLRFRPLRGVNIKDIIEQLAGHSGGTGGRQGRLAQVVKAYRLLKTALSDMGDSCYEACQGSDLMIYAPLIPGVFDTVAEELTIPRIIAALQPFDITSEFPCFIFTRSLGGYFNRLSYPIAWMAGWSMYRSGVNVWRQKRFQLPPLEWNYLLHTAKGSVPRIYGFSPSVIPKPLDWGPHSSITGYWFLDQSQTWQPPSTLLDFLESGPPPVYIGFGSMIMQDPESAVLLVLKTLDRIRQRGVLLTGWTGLRQTDLPDHVISVDAVPHEWLFPRTVAAVHHGGAGTTAAALRAGVPSIIIPFIIDQPFWGQRVFGLGTGPQPIPRKKLTPDRLSAAIHKAITNTPMRQRAAALGERIRSEDGVAQAVDCIHHIMWLQ